MTLANGIAFGDRTIGNLARPFFPDGINGNPNGPLSKPFPQWSPFSTGLQLEVSLAGIGQALCIVAGDQVFAPVPPPNSLKQLLGPNCGFVPAPPPPPPFTTCTAPSLNTIRNGLQIFAGSVPIFRGGTLIGAIGVSGDGIDQDDMVAFLGLNNGGVTLGGAIGNAPPAIRGDNVGPSNTGTFGSGKLRYVSCPVAPFLDSTEQTPCAGK